MKIKPNPSEGCSVLKRATWPTCWDKPFRASGGADALALIWQCRERAWQMQLAMAQAREQGQFCHGSQLQRRYLMSYSAQLDALSRAYEKKAGPLAKASAEDRKELVTAAEAISPWHGSSEKTIAYPQQKKGGGYRLVRVHGIIQYALETLAVAAAKPFAQISDNQFITRGGIPKLNDWLRERLAGTELVITVDIPRCFDLMKRSSVADNLHLPRGVVERVLYDPMDRAILCTKGVGGSDLNDLMSNVQVSSPRRGIPQGSPLAQLSSEIVIALVLQAVAAVTPNIQVASHGDNLIFLLEDASSKGAVVHALTSAVAEHFGQDVSSELTCRIEYARPSTGFRFCRRTYLFKSGAMRILLPVDWVDDFAFKTALRIGDAHRSKNDQAFDKIEWSIKGWLRHSPKSDVVVNMAAELLCDLKVMRKTAMKPAS